MRQFLLVFLFAMAPVWGQGKKPEKPSSQNDKPSHSTKTVKDGANDALDDLDHGIHKAAGAAKEGANQALGAIDKGVHKVVGSEKK